MYGAANEKLAAVYKLGVTDTSAKFSACGGAAVPAKTTSIMLVPASSSTESRIAMAGTASAASARVPPTGVAIPITKADADLIEIWTVDTAEVTLMVYVERD